MGVEADLVQELALGVIVEDDVDALLVEGAVVAVELDGGGVTGAGAGADQEQLRTVGEGGGFGDFLGRAVVLDDLVAADHRVVAAAARQFFLQAERVEVLTELVGQGIRGVAADAEEQRVIAVFQEPKDFPEVDVRIGHDEAEVVLVCQFRGAAGLGDDGGADGEVPESVAVERDGGGVDFVGYGGHLDGGQDVRILRIRRRREVELQGGRLDVRIQILNIIQQESGIARVVDPGQGEGADGVDAFLVLCGAEEVDVGETLHEGTPAADLRVDIVGAELFDQGIRGGEEVGAQAEAAARNLHAHGGESGGKNIQSGVISAPGGIRRGLRGVDDGGIGAAEIVLRHVLAEIVVHRGVVAGDHDRGVLVEILLLTPLHEFRHLAAGAGHDVGVLVVAELIAAQTADIAVLEVRVDGQEGQVEGLPAHLRIQQEVARVFEELLVLVAPEDGVVGIDPAVLLRVVVVADGVVAVNVEEEPPAAEGGVGAEQEDLVVAFCRQDVADGVDFVIEVFLCGHVVALEQVILLDKILGDPLHIRLQREAGGDAEHRAHREAGPGQDPPAVQRVVAAGEVLVLFGEGRELRNGILRKSSPVLRIRIRDLHRLQVDHDQVALLLRKSQLRVGRGHVIVLDEGGRVHLVGDVAADVHPDPESVEGIREQGESQQRHDHTDRLVPGLPFPFQARLQQEQQDRDRDGHDDRRDHVRNDETPDHPVAGPLQRCVQLIDDFIDIQLRPEGEDPSLAQPQEESQRHGQRQRKEPSERPTDRVRLLLLFLIPSCPVCLFLIPHISLICGRIRPCAYNYTYIW